MRLADLTRREQLVFAALVLIARRRMWRTRNGDGTNSASYAATDAIGAYPITGAPVAPDFAEVLAFLIGRGLVVYPPRTVLGELALTRNGRAVLAEATEALNMAGLVNLALSKVPPHPHLRDTYGASV